MSQTDRQQNELRVFISSTFRDLQEEREHLVKKIFPEIRSLCRERGITFTEVDLRWGLTEEDQVLGQIIRTCLEEIDRCRPYFIGITGERYGYIPDVTDIYKDPELLRLYPWIEDAATDEMAIIEMEFRHGAIGFGNEVGTAGKDSTARFYFRRQRARFDETEDRPKEWFTRSEGAGDAERLDHLKEEVRRKEFPIAEFRDPASLGEMIYDDLVEIIKRDFAHVKPPTPLEQERSRHAAFAASRRHAYIPNTGYLKRINEFIDFRLPIADFGLEEDTTTADPSIENSTDASTPNRKSKIQNPKSDNCLVIYAESGSGKSSLISYWADQYRRRNPEANVIEHYVGIGAGTTDHYAIMRHVMEEIKARFNRDEEIPSTPEQIEQQFANWLGFTIASRPIGEGPGEKVPVVLILDGINQLQGAALGLNWLPKFIPNNIHLIITSTVEQTLVELRGRGWEQLGMQPLTEKEREAIIVRFLSEYRKALSADQVRRIAEDQKCSHPLFLRTLLEELRLFGQHERLEGEIDRYLATTGTEDLFQVVLERIEEDFGGRTVREVMSLIWASRFGLSEIELQELTGVSRMKISSLVMSLDYHLVRRDGLLTFFHDYLRRAVEKRYLPEDDKKRRQHLQLADYFEVQVEAAIEADRKRAEAEA